MELVESRRSEGAGCSTGVFQESPFWRKNGVRNTPLPINNGVTTSIMLQTIGTQRPRFEIDIPVLLLEFERSFPELTAEGLCILHGHIISMYSDSSEIFGTNVCVSGSLSRCKPSGFKISANRSNRLELRFEENNEGAIYTSDEKVEFVQPCKVPDLLQKLIEGANEFSLQAATQDLPSKVVFMATFYLRFLALHPFEKGNGRMATMLWLFLSKKVFGFYVPFVPEDALFRNYINQKGQFNDKKEVLNFNSIDGGDMITYIIDCAFMLFEPAAPINRLYKKIKTGLGDDEGDAQKVDDVMKRLRLVDDEGDAHDNIEKVDDVMITGLGDDDGDAHGNIEKVDDVMKRLSCETVKEVKEDKPVNDDTEFDNAVAEWTDRAYAHVLNELQRSDAAFRLVAKAEELLEQYTFTGLNKECEELPQTRLPLLTYDVEPEHKKVESSLPLLRDNVEPELRDNVELEHKKADQVEVVAEWTEWARANILSEHRRSDSAFSFVAEVEEMIEQYEFTGLNKESEKILPLLKYDWEDEEPEHNEDEESEHKKVDKFGEIRAEKCDDTEVRD